MTKQTNLDAAKELLSGCCEFILALDDLPYPHGFNRQLLLQRLRLYREKYGLQIDAEAFSRLRKAHVDECVRCNGEVE